MSEGLFKPSNAVEGQGLLDDVDAVIKEARAKIWDYNGKVPVPVPALCLTMTVDGMEEDQIQYFSLGKSEDWQPNEDGTSIMAVGKATGLVKSSNAMLFITSLVNAGFPEDKITDDLRCFEGTKVHLTRIPAPKRGGIPKPPRADGRVFEDTVLTVGSIISFPWDKKAPAAPKGKPAVGGKTAAPATAPASTTTGADADDVDTKSSEIIMQILSEHPEGVTKSQIPGFAFKLVDKADPLKNKIITRVFQEDFLKAGAWSYEGGKVTLG